MPSRSDVNSKLLERVSAFAEAYCEEFPQRRLSVINATRTIEKQQAAFAKKFSKIDGKTKFSLHNFTPSLAVDVWVYEMRTDIGLPPALSFGRIRGGTLQLMQRSALKDYYIPMGEIAEGFELEAGALWKKFRDGPHLQLPKEDLIKVLQDKVSQATPIAVDGDWGPKSRDAAKRVAKRFGVPSVAKGPCPMHPALWAALHS